jgi:hypothetical protein
MENMLAKIIKEINIIKAIQEKDGLFIMEKLKHQKYLMNGIHGCIT